MPRFKIAHVKDNDVNVIIVPVSTAFGALSAEAKDRILAALQERAVADTLKGRVVPVWDDGGRMRFIAPREWHRFFARLTLKTVRAHLNRELDLTQAPVAPHEAGDAAPLLELLDAVDPHEAWPAPPKNDSSLLARVTRLLGLAR